MRVSVFAAILISASSALASPVLKTDSVDKAVKSVDTPKNFHQDCDSHNVQCRATNEIVYGAVNVGSASVGKQVGNIAHTGSLIAAKEGDKDLAKTLATNGPVLQHDLQGRDRHGHSDLNEGLKKAGDAIYPQDLLFDGGKFVQTQGESAQIAGNGANTVGKQANKDGQFLSKGQKQNGGKLVNSVVG
ncbi:uncharacterized protein I303_101142 [Kwoniella dejecticola CBS 10117]|uniref:Uncharacterized protein n=1 Tax=Kwoniella dejecticola CBS 10117 TaxID=1296121 RepID=A0A1A6AGX9_9TREE|nr:uncharacterized protein I303_01148 [Kwoniella dejecticola CBS 10117]OBR89322.1 hypothetical protein I303_01148 [Kwoniella dejecticola CBS 10117]